MDAETVQHDEEGSFGRDLSRCAPPSSKPNVATARVLVLSGMPASQFLARQIDSPPRKTQRLRRLAMLSVASRARRPAPRIVIPRPRGTDELDTSISPAACRRSCRPATVPLPSPARFIAPFRSSVRLASVVDEPTRSLDLPPHPPQHTLIHPPALLQRLDRLSKLRVEMTLSILRECRYCG